MDERHNEIINTQMKEINEQKNTHINKRTENERINELKVELTNIRMGE